MMYTSFIKDSVLDCESRSRVRIAAEDIQGQFSSYIQFHIKSYVVLLVYNVYLPNL